MTLNSTTATTKKIISSNAQRPTGPRERYLPHPALLFPLACRRCGERECLCSESELDAGGSA